MDLAIIDRRTALFRIHLPGDHVLSLFIFRARTCPRIDHYGGCRTLRPLYFVDSLVSLLEKEPLY